MVRVCYICIPYVESDKGKKADDGDVVVVADPRQKKLEHGTQPTPLGKRTTDKPHDGEDFEHVQLQS